MIIVSDTSPLIHLSACNHLHLLQTLYGQIVIPASVDEEIRLKCKDERIRQEVMAASGYLSEPRQIPIPSYERVLFERKLRELGLTNEFIGRTMDRLGQWFTL